MTSPRFDRWLCTPVHLRWLCTPVHLLTFHYGSPGDCVPLFIFWFFITVHPVTVYPCSSSDFFTAVHAVTVYPCSSCGFTSFRPVTVYPCSSSVAVYPCSSSDFFTTVHPVTVHPCSSSDFSPRFTRWPGTPVHLLIFSPRFTRWLCTPVHILIFYDGSPGDRVPLFIFWSFTKVHPVDLRGAVKWLERKSSRFTKIPDRRFKTTPLTISLFIYSAAAIFLKYCVQETPNPEKCLLKLQFTPA